MDMNHAVFTRTIALVALTFLASACIDLRVKRGRGDIITEKVRVGDFSRLRIGGNFKVTLSPGVQPSVLIRTNENLIEYIHTELNGDELDISSRYHLKGTEGVHIDIVYTRLEGLVSAGASSIVARDPVAASRLELEISGAGSMDLRLEADDLRVRMSGAGAIKLDGVAERSDIDISGAGGLDAGQLQCRVCEINLSGVGGADIHVTDELIARITGLGGISYRGNPARVDKVVTGLGRISAEKDENI
jgi:hypothetical protein